MALLTGLGSVAKGSVATLGLDKGELGILISGLSDSYFQNIDNIEKAVVVYKSTQGKQTKKIIFDLSQESPSGTVLFSQKARDEFAIDKIILLDFDGGNFVMSSGFDAQNISFAVSYAYSIDSASSMGGSASGNFDFSPEMALQGTAVYEVVDGQRGNYISGPIIVGYGNWDWDVGPNLPFSFAIFDADGNQISNVWSFYAD